MTLTHVGYARRDEDFVPAWSSRSGAERAVDSPKYVAEGAVALSRLQHLAEFEGRARMLSCALEVRREKLGLFVRETFDESHDVVADAEGLAAADARGSADCDDLDGVQRAR
jgi:hypothetical protein